MGSANRIRMGSFGRWADGNPNHSLVNSTGGRPGSGRARSIRGAGVRVHQGPVLSGTLDPSSFQGDPLTSPVSALTGRSGHLFYLLW